jgi:protein SCO1
MGLSEGMIACRWCRNSIFYFLAILGICSCTASASKQEAESLPFYNTASFDAEWISATDSAYRNIHTIDTFSLKDQRGITITKDSLDGYIYLANFFFTSCPGICPKMVSNLSILQDSLAMNKTVKLVSFSVMPWVDSVSTLQTYGRINGITPGQWYLLTGNKDRIYTLARQSYFAEKGLGLQKDNSEFLHTESMLLIDKKGRIRGIYNATQKVEVERVMDDLRMLLKE